MYEDSDVVATAVDILISIAEFNASILRDHILTQTETFEEVSREGNLGGGGCPGEELGG